MSLSSSPILWMAGVLMVSIALGLCAAPGTTQIRGLAESYIPKLDKNLKENILPFWLTKTLDRTDGGYIMNIGPAGEPLGPANKMIVTQARQLWLFSRLARAEIREKECLEAAELGYRFLREKMWDSRHGGFFWEVDAAGGRHIRADKHLYGQAFALYALSEYQMATKRKDVLELAVRLFKLLESKAHDKEYGGYIEFFSEQWGKPPAGANSPVGGAADGKLMNTHLHLLEAITAFYKASRLPLARERLLELIAIETNTVVRKNLGACTDKYRRDWTPLLEGDLARVSYGHDIENVWLVMEACRAAEVAERPYLDLFRTLWDYSLRYGYDEADGGFFYTGAFNRPADDRNKAWWVQAEAIVSALRMYQATGERKYLTVFEKTYDYIERHITDWKNGEWHDTILPDGKPRGNKAHAWKGGYHNGRAMIESIRILRELK